MLFAFVLIPWAGAALNGFTYMQNRWVWAFALLESFILARVAPRMAALTAAETGHLILSTLHTIGAANTIDRIIDAFPANQQHQIVVQLSMVLHAIISQRLLPTKDGREIPAFEVMILTPAIRNMIREGKIHQIDGVISTSADQDMIAMDTSIYKLYQDGVITAETAVSHAMNPEMMAKRLKV